EPPALRDATNWRDRLFAEPVTPTPTTKKTPPLPRPG
ncbi:MAG: hypothetical protein QOF33_1628, partial [Thermomicrobiales bacterium]|nr:hypothetical protein [Thermomicrobiales bacterium]